jgi:hypothetical protein
MVRVIVLLESLRDLPTRGRRVYTATAKGKRALDQSVTLSGRVSRQNREAT